MQIQISLNIHAFKLVFLTASSLKSETNGTADFRVSAKSYRTKTEASWEYQ